MISTQQVPKINKKKASYRFTLFLFKSTVMECNEELFPERWYEKSTFPKQATHIMSTLRETKMQQYCFFIQSMSYSIFFLVFKILTEP